MVSVATVMSWTGLELPEGTIRVFEPVAVQRLQADCNSIVEPMKTQALCYLIALYHSNTQTSEQFGSEGIGGYSYSRRDPADIPYWEGKYQSVLASVVPVSELSPASSNRVDRHILHLGGNGMWGGQ